mmetsp:Transcript_18337/g.25698  ORF Transcript_18337/g.25698 Transcript_18337/m.25698 type:complete len:446 (-) Transcript_18337:18-1355(-)
MPQLDSLPHEIQLHIVGFLEVHDVIFRVCLLSKYFFHLCWNDASVWKNLCERKWLYQFTHAYEYGAFIQRWNFNWKRYFIQKYLIEKAKPFSWKVAQKVKGTPITTRCQHSATAHRNNIIVVGGQLTDSLRYNHILVYDTSQNFCSKINPNEKHPPTHAMVANSLNGVVTKPPVMSKHTAVLLGEVMYLFGGFDGVSSMYELQAYHPDSETWVAITDVKGDVPPPNTNHAMCSVGNKIYIYGGLVQGKFDQAPRYADDLYCLDVETLTWTLLQPKGRRPEHRCAHKLNAVGSKLFLFGGGIGSKWEKRYNDMCVYDVETNEWLRPKCSYTEINSVGVCTYTSSWVMDNFIFYFGGAQWEKDVVSNEVFVFDTVTCNWSKLQVHGTPPMSRDQATTTVVGDTIYIVNGYRGGAIEDFSMLKMNEHVYKAFFGAPVEPFGLSGHVEM